MLIVLSQLVISGPVNATVPGTNGKIAFASQRDGNYEIYVANPDGSGPTRLTNATSDDLQPVWSPDGTKIAFTSLRDQNGQHEIYVMNADGSNQTRLTNNTFLDLNPSWSPDGTKIAFEGGAQGASGQEIYVMNPDGSGITRITNNNDSDFDPTWSPDGTKIAFTSTRFDPGTQSNYELWVMNADGSGATRLTNNPANDLEPAWSPDGTRIAFRSNRDGGKIEIYVMNADGTGPKRLTNNADDDRSPAWSPDGTQIAFSSLRGNSFDIYVMNADGSGQKTLINHTSHDTFPDWQSLAPAPEPEPLDFQDGGFETPDDQGEWVSYGQGRPGGETLGAWDVTGTVDHVRELWKAAAGKFSVDLNGDGNGSVFQDLSTTPGASYELSFAIAGHMGCGGPVKTMDVMWGGKKVKSVTFDTAGHSYADMGWRRETATLVAEVASTRLEFITTTAGTCGPAIDEVTLKGGAGSGETTPPKTTIFWSPEHRTSDRTPAFKFRSNEKGSTFVCKLDSQPFTSCSSPQVYSRQDFGAHTFKVKAIDVSGNKDVTPATHKWRIVADK
jgi:choice-of-anchor C domain-containing protein